MPLIRAVALALGEVPELNGYWVDGRHQIAEAIHLGFVISLRQGCIAYHAHDAVKAGATRQEILETLGISIMMGGGPAMVYACQALEALDQFTPSGTAPAASPDTASSERKD